MFAEIPGARLKAIGTIRNRVKQRPASGWDEIVSEVDIDHSLTEALDGLEEFSHIIVVYWMHQIPPSEQVPTKVHPRNRPDLPLVGLFATRAPYRLNPIGATAVKLLERRGNVLTVKGLDAVDGTPVIDVKPYLPKRDSVADARTPLWVKKL